MIQKNVEKRQREENHKIQIQNAKKTKKDLNHFETEISVQSLELNKKQDVTDDMILEANTKLSKCIRDGNSGNNCCQTAFRWSSCE